MDLALRDAKIEELDHVEYNILRLAYRTVPQGVILENMDNKGNEDKDDDNDEDKLPHFGGLASTSSNRELLRTIKTTKVMFKKINKA
ncbi:hypothetical protein QQS21_001925 [Conoideocrella luteorostrata]|uniref:Uncharacterized protein n=1 Tax=Conoideocrella luteorostrata TaxID=1105319 RepID=A0AAJ0G372_9HYPO|nr:hypothetical protein QQS21_001925 [Conoideocrella luteorostrata]